MKNLNDSEINLYIKDFQQQIAKIDFNDEKLRKINLGMVGENIVDYCIKQSMWELGYSLDDNGNSGTFSIILHYGANDNNVGGIDNKLTFIDKEGKVYVLLIELKNWGYYPINEDWFYSEILARYMERDVNGKSFWVVVIKTQSIRYIEKWCIKHSIRILPLNDYITPQHIMDDNRFRDTLVCLIQEFISLIKSIIGSVPDKEHLKYEFSGKTELIIEDIAMGKPYDVIAEKYNIKKSYIMKLASAVRKSGRRIPDRRRRAWGRYYDKSNN